MLHSNVCRIYTIEKAKVQTEALKFLFLIVLLFIAFFFLLKGILMKKLIDYIRFQNFYTF